MRRIPFSSAEPAEFVSAGLVSASHVITALVLFDGMPASRALLGINQNPFSVCRLVCIFAHPCLSGSTFTGTMVFSAAFKAVEVPASAKHRSGDQTWIFNAELAVWGWAPFNSFVFFSIGHRDLFFISNHI